MCLLLDALFDLCRECKTDVTVLPKSPLGQACSYALKNETALRLYCTDGRLSIDNIISERTLREFVIGRKNWLFFGSPEAAKNSANIMSVLSSAKRHGLNEWGEFAGHFSQCETPLQPAAVPARSDTTQRVPSRQVFFRSIFL